jgi:predicted small lipoprotein YifL
MTKAALLIASLLSLAACGVRAPLQPEPGESLPVAPETAPSQPTAEELLRRPPIAAPARVDELLTRSEERADDRFDLPPQ